MRKLTRQSALAAVASVDASAYVRLAAVEKLADQAALAQIARHDADWNVRRAAVGRLKELRGEKQERR